LRKEKRGDVLLIRGGK